MNDIDLDLMRVFAMLAEADLADEITQQIITLLNVKKQANQSTGIRADNVKVAMADQPDAKIAMFDTDGDGIIDLSELAAGLDTDNDGVVTELELLKAMDADGDGKITFNELSLYLTGDENPRSGGSGPDGSDESDATENADAEKVQAFGGEPAPVEDQASKETGAEDNEVEEADDEDSDEAGSDNTDDGSSTLGDPTVRSLTKEGLTEALDLNDDGIISKAELLSVIDRNKDGKISPNELLQFMITSRSRNTA